MIFKTYTRRTASFKQLVNYISHPIEKGKDPVLHNIDEDPKRLQMIINDFMRNSRHIFDSLYARQTSKPVVLHHEIISLSSNDKERVTEDILNDLARKYLELRAPEAKAFALSQFNTANPHIHLVISANKAESSEKMHISNKAFFSIRQEMDKYLAVTYPELQHSLLFTEGVKRQKGLNLEGELKETWYEQERVKRLKKAGKEVTPSKKQMLRNTLLTIFTVAMSKTEFVNLLKEEGLTIYQRGQNVGVIDREGMKYRLATLGLEEVLRTTLYQWAAMPGRTAEEQRIKFEKVERKITQWGFKEDIQLALKEEPSDLDLIFKEKRRQKRERGIRRRRILR